MSRDQWTEAQHRLHDVIDQVIDDTGHIEPVDLIGPVMHAIRSDADLDTALKARGLYAAVVHVFGERATADAETSGATAGARPDRATASDDATDHPGGVFPTKRGVGLKTE